MPTINDRLSDSAIRLGRYEGRVGFSVWRDDSPEGMVLIGIIWDDPADDGTRQESWDAYGSVRWPVARMPTGCNLASARLQALDMLARNGVISTGVDAILRGWLESGNLGNRSEARAFPMAFCYPPTQQRAEPGSDMARDKRMTVMVEAEFMDEVKEAARNRRMKMSEWIRLVVENELRTEKERRS